MKVFGAIVGVLLGQQMIRRPEAWSIWGGIVGTWLGLRALRGRARRRAT